MINFKNISLKLISHGDKKMYYEAGFKKPDNQVAYYTGTDGTFTYEQISKFVDMTLSIDNRKHFLIFSDAIIVGEIVFSNIENNSCDFRIAIFNQNNFNKKYGTNAMKAGFDFAFYQLGIKTIYLEVYDYNLRGIHVYSSFGFEEVSRFMKENGMNSIKMQLTPEKYTDFR